MSHKVNLVRVFTAATGNSTPITLGAAYSQLFMTPAEAGAMDGRVYTYLIVDGNDWEMGRGAYTASGTSLARTTIIASRISGTLGTSRITLTGTAQVRFIEAAEDMDGVRGTRAVTVTSDVLANSDQGYVVTYSNAGAISVSLAQAGSSNLFLAGWATRVQNTGAGTVTITPATSTINGVATLTLATGMGAFIWSDGTNYRAQFVPASKPLLAANNLSDVTAATARSNIGAQAALGYTPANKAGDTFSGFVNATAGLGVNGYYEWGSPTGTSSNPLRVSVYGSTSYRADLVYTDYYGGKKGFITTVLADTASAIFSQYADGSMTVPGAFTAASKSFLIDHPTQPADKDLVFMATEGPKNGVEFWGAAQLVDGEAVVDIDAASNMSAGTFAALTQRAIVDSLNNLDGFTRVRASRVVDGKFMILAIDEDCADEIAWHVVAERADPYIKTVEWCDPQTGILIPEHDKPDYPEAA